MPTAQPSEESERVGDFYKAHGRAKDRASDLFRLLRQDRRSDGVQKLQPIQDTVTRSDLLDQVQALLALGCSPMTAELVVSVVESYMYKRGGRSAGSNFDPTITSHEPRMNLGLTSRKPRKNTSPLPSVSESSLISLPGLEADPERAHVSEKSAEKADAGTVTPPGFAEFWAVYWKRVKRAKAEVIWSKIDPGQDLTQVIVRAVLTQRAEQMSRPPDKRTHPTTWLNGREWENETDAPVQQPTNGHGRPIPIPRYDPNYEDPL